MSILTNATKIVKTCKVVYTTVGYIMEAFEDTLQVLFMRIGFIVFGQFILANEENCFSNWSKITEVIDKLPLIGDGK